MPLRREPYPAFSWSHTRARTLAECERRYFHHYYGAHNGWLAESPPGAKQAWRLKQLQTLFQALGAAVHARARELALAHQHGAEPPAFEAALARTRADLNRLWLLSRDRAGFLRDPKRHPMLHGAYYGRPADPAQIELVRARLEACLRHLYACPIWAELRACGPGDIRVVDELAHFEVEGVTVYVAPDLVYRARGPNGWTVVDWKTGAEAGVEEQVAVYALYARDHLRLPLEGGRCRCRVIRLGEGGEAGYWVGPREMAVARARIRVGVARMRGLLADPAANAPLERERFRLAPDRRPCWSCNFWELCESEFARPGEERTPA